MLLHPIKFEICDAHTSKRLKSTKKKRALLCMNCEISTIDAPILFQKLSFKRSFASGLCVIEWLIISNFILYTESPWWDILTLECIWQFFFCYLNTWGTDVNIYEQIRNLLSFTMFLRWNVNLPVRFKTAQVGSLALSSDVKSNEHSRTRTRNKQTNK